MSDRETSTRTRPATVLVVEDCDAEALNLEILLKHHGFRVRVANNGAHGLELYDLERPDVILTDLLMPVMDGFDFISQVRSRPDAASVPILVVSGLDDYDNIGKAIDCGADDYLLKPLNKALLRVRIRAALEKYVLEKKQQDHLRELEWERSKSERLLLNILPRPIAERLKEDTGIIAEKHPDCTVLFADIVDFTKFASQADPHRLVHLLNRVFSAFDRLAENHGLEKIKTMGDSYMAVCGVPMARPDHAEAAARMALDMLEEIRRHRGTGGEPLRLRIGIHSGPLVAGVIGTKKFIYDLWGDTVNLASRMESQGVPGYIQATTGAFERLRQQFVFERRGAIHVKGRGEMVTYFLLGERDEISQTDDSPESGLLGEWLARADEELWTLSLVDDLTGLRSRQGFMALFHQQEQVARRDKKGILLLLVRLENLDELNRTRGADAGDLALIETGRLLSGSFRTSDNVARISGDSFLVAGNEVTRTQDNALQIRFTRILEERNRDRPEHKILHVRTASQRWDPLNPVALNKLLEDMEKILLHKAHQGPQNLS